MRTAHISMAMTHKRYRISGCHRDGAEGLDGQHTRAAVKQRKEFFFGGGVARNSRNFLPEAVWIGIFIAHFQLLFLIVKHW